MSAAETQKQVLLLGSQAAKVFERKAFELVEWVGIFGFFPHGKLAKAKMNPIEVAIFYKPDCSENQIWEWYSRYEENDWGSDPDEPKLVQAWGGRRVVISRIF